MVQKWGVRITGTPTLGRFGVAPERRAFRRGFGLLCGKGLRETLRSGSAWPPPPQNFQALGEVQTKSEQLKERSSLELLNTVLRIVHHEVSLGFRKEVTRQAEELISAKA